METPGFFQARRAKPRVKRPSPTRAHQRRPWPKSWSPNRMAKAPSRKAYKPSKKMSVTSISSGRIRRANPYSPPNLSPLPKSQRASKPSTKPSMPLRTKIHQTFAVKCFMATSFCRFPYGIGTPKPWFSACGFEPGARSPMESAHPNHGSQLAASNQGPLPRGHKPRGKIWVCQFPNKELALHPCDRFPYGIGVPSQKLICLLGNVRQPNFLHPLDGGTEFVEVGGLHQEITGPRLIGLAHILLRPGVGQDHHRDIPERGIGLEFVEDIEAVPPGQAQVQYDQV